MADERTKKGKGSSDYTGKDIQVLTGLKPVRLRPSMFTGNTSTSGLHQLYNEALDNAVDEALNGFCDRIRIVLGQDGYISVADNGRGIPVDRHPATRQNTLQTIMTKLHSGGKFSNKTYQVSGGLHGVGISVVNALSIDMEVFSSRDGNCYKQTFSRGRKKTDLENLGPTDKRGTKIRFRPDSEIFKDLTFDIKIIKDRARVKAFLTRGLTIEVLDERTREEETFFFPEGLKDYARELAEGKDRITEEPFHLAVANEMRAEVVLWWTSTTLKHIHSFANSIPTPSGGTHEAGLKGGISRAVREFLSRNSVSLRGIRGLVMEDMLEGLVGLISVFLPGQAEFQGQTKDRLGSDIQPKVEALVRAALTDYLFTHPTAAEAIIRRMSLAARAREASRRAREEVVKKGVGRYSLPGKLADCSSKKVAARELFIVEGDSAGGSSKQARDRRFQAVLPLRGKILNVEQATPERIRKNREIQDLIACLGTGAGESFDIKRLRYGKIFINTDADVDGHHIAALILTLFFRHLREIVERGRLYIAMPPLYKLSFTVKKKRRVLYLYTEEEKESALKKLGKRSFTLQRFKGLGEMNPKELKETTMDPKKRKAVRVTIPDAQRAEESVRTLFGKDSKKRFEFIQENAQFAREVDI